MSNELYYRRIAVKLTLAQLHLLKEISDSGPVSIDMTESSPDSLEMQSNILALLHFDVIKSTVDISVSVPDVIDYVITNIGSSVLEDHHVMITCDKVRTYQRVQYALDSMNQTESMLLA